MLTPVTLTAKYKLCNGLAVVFLEKGWHFPRLKPVLRASTFPLDFTGCGKRVRLYCECLLAILRFRFRPVLIHFFASRIPTTRGSPDPLSGLRFCRNQLGQADQIRCGRV